MTMACSWSPILTRLPLVFNPSWAGLEPWMVQGPDNVPLLSIRDVNESTTVGTYSFRERVRSPIHYLRATLIVLARSCTNTSDLQANVALL